jgi:transposase-like protein
MQGPRRNGLRVRQMSRLRCHLCHCALQVRRLATLVRPDKPRNYYTTTTDDSGAIAKATWSVSGLSSKFGRGDGI